MAFTRGKRSSEMAFSIQVSLPQSDQLAEANFRLAMMLFYTMAHLKLPLIKVANWAR